MNLPSPMPRWRGAAGFTMIELMIVISIMAMIIAAGVPGLFRSMKKEGMRKAVSDVVEGCSHARARAILHGVPMELVIRAEDGRIAVRRVQSGSGAGAEDGPGAGAPPPPVFADSEFDAPVPAKAGPDFTAAFSEDIAVKFLDVNFKDQMEMAETKVRFFPNGTSDEFTIVLMSKDEERKISLDVVTGLANVELLK